MHGLYKFSLSLLLLEIKNHQTKFFQLNEALKAKSPQMQGSNTDLQW